jgi:isoleucyl-tRNA synthetase
MNKELLNQQKLEDDNFCSYNQDKIYTKQIEHSLPFEKKQTAEVTHLQDIIKRSKTSPNKQELIMSDSESKRMIYTEEEVKSSKENRSEKFQKLKQKFSEKLNNLSEYEIELGEKDFKDQISEKIKERNELEKNPEINLSDINNLRILDSFGGNRTQNKQPLTDENNMTSLEKKMFSKLSILCSNRKMNKSR